MSKRGGPLAFVEAASATKVEVSKPAFRDSAALALAARSIS
jgi:hypothetical protein